MDFIKLLPHLIPYRVRFKWWGVLGWLHWSSPLIDFNKTFFSLPRLHNLFHVSEQNPLAILGRHSLPVFVTGTIFAMFGQIIKTVITGTFFSDTLLIISGIMVQFCVAYYCEKYQPYQQFSTRKPIGL